MTHHIILWKLKEELTDAQRILGPSGTRDSGRWPCPPLYRRKILSGLRRLCLTQSQLAKLAKVGINTLTQIERGEGNPTVAVLDRVLSTLGLQLTATTIEV